MDYAEMLMIFCFGIEIDVDFAILYFIFKVVGVADDGHGDFGEKALYKIIHCIIP